MAREYRISPLQVRLACAAALLTFGMTALLAGARLGVVHLDAGEMQIWNFAGLAAGRSHQQSRTQDILAHRLPPRA